MSRLSVKILSLFLVLGFSSAHVWAGGAGEQSEEADAGAAFIGHPIPIRELASGFYNQNVTSKRFILAKSEHQLEQISRLIGTSLDVDMDKYMVLAVFMGSQPTGGYNIEVERVVKTRQKLLAQVLNTSPGESCPVTMAVTSPYQVVMMPRSEAKFHIQERDHVVFCP